MQTLLCIEPYHFYVFDKSDIMKDYCVVSVTVIAVYCSCEMFCLENYSYLTLCQGPALNIMAVFPSHMRFPSLRVSSPYGRARTWTVGRMTTVIPHQGPNSTTVPEWRPPQVTCTANVAISASSPRTPTLQTSTTQSQALRAAAALPHSPAGEAKDKASSPKKTAYQT